MAPATRHSIQAATPTTRLRTNLSIFSTLQSRCSKICPPTRYVSSASTFLLSADSFQWLSNAGITPSSSKTYTNTAITSALKAKFGATPILTCTSGELNQVQYAFNVRGSVANGNFVPVNPTGTSGNCPKTGIKYLPKDLSTTPQADEGSCG